MNSMILMMKQSDEGRTEDLGNMEGADDNDDTNASIDNIDTNEQLHNDIMVRQKFDPNLLIF